MKAATNEELTRLLADLKNETSSNLPRVLPLVYDELRELAASHLNRERDDHTLQPTALVHEAYMRLMKKRRFHCESRAQFFSAVATIIRRILVDHSRGRESRKRGGGQKRISIQDIELPSGQGEVDLVVLDETLTRLAELDPRRARVVELRVFSGLSVDEIADLLQISPRTVHYDWRLATAWLSEEIEQERNRER